jgi:1-phosphatidylinositol phosphodiesterase
MSNWMARLSGNESLADLTLPGTHDSHCTNSNILNWNVVVAPFAATQAIDISEQLVAGVRFIDLRCGYDDAGNIQMRHGTIALKGTLQDVVNVVALFLSSNTSEAIIASVKWDQSGVNEPDTFGPAVDKITQTIGSWYTGTTVPLVRDCRGKIVLLRRYQGKTGLTVEHWPYNNPHFTSNDGSIVVQDQCDFAKSPDRQQCFTTKWSSVKVLLDEAQNTKGPLFINWCSSASLPWPLITPSQFASSVNDEIGKYMVSIEGQKTQAIKLGMVIQDFPDTSMIQRLILTNFAS